DHPRRRGPVAVLRPLPSVLVTRHRSTRPSIPSPGPPDVPGHLTRRRPPRRRLLAPQVAVDDVHLDPLVAQACGELLGHGDTAVLAPGAAHRERHVVLTLALVP